MPNRMLREDILGSAKVDALSFGAEVFYRRLMSVVDDYGRFEADPVLLLARCFPRRFHKVTVGEIVCWLEECRKSPASGGNLPASADFSRENQPLVTVYRIEGKNFLQINNFNQRLRPNQRSKYPGPEDVSREVPGSSGNSREKSASRAQTATTPATTPAEVLEEKDDEEILDAEIVPGEPMRCGDEIDPVLILAEVRRIYKMGGLPIPDGEGLERILIQQIISAKPEKRPRILDFVKFGFASGRWPTPAKTKAFRNVMADGDWDVELTQRTLPNAREPTPGDAMRAEASAKAAQYMREKGRL